MKQKGFTIIELVVVMAIIAILLTSVIIAVDPASKFAEARNSQRQSDIKVLIAAVYQYYFDNNGYFPGDSSNPQNGTNAVGASPIGSSSPGSDIGSGLGWCAALVTIGKYLPSLPHDPQVNTGASYTNCTGTLTTSYKIWKDTNNRINIWAIGSELSVTITVIE